MKKIVILAFLVLSQGCDAFSDQEAQYSPEELLGKTVAEHEALQEKKDDAPAKQQQVGEPNIRNGFLQIGWEALIAPGYDAEAIMAKYEPLINDLEDGTDAAIALYKKMDEEFDNAPANDALAKKKISLPGFIAPLEQSNGIITEFLLVPYFGACIHMPPPPANQTVYVKVAPDYGIDAKDSYSPIWVSGTLVIDDADTEIGSASYQINDALISPYKRR